MSRLQLILRKGRCGKSYVLDSVVTIIKNIYGYSDSNYLVDEEKWIHNLRRLEFLVQNYAFGDFSLDIQFAFKTLGVLPNSKSKYMYWTIGQKTNKSDQDCDVWDTFQSIVLPKISVPYITKGKENNCYILGFEINRSLK